MFVFNMKIAFFLLYYFVNKIEYSTKIRNRVHSYLKYIGSTHFHFEKYRKKKRVKAILNDTRPCTRFLFLKSRAYNIIIMYYIDIIVWYYTI